jgi:hypothetical protein
MDHCPYCLNSFNNMVHLAEASDADQQAIEDIRKQWINERNPQLKLLLKMRLDVLVKEVNSAKTFEEEMKKATNRLYRAIAEMVQQGQGQMLVAMSPDELKSFLISSGMGDALTYFERSQVDIVELINKATIAIDPEFRSAPPNIIQAIAQQTSSQVFDAQILPSLSSAIRNMATTAVIVGSSKPVLDQMRIAFEKSVGVGTTQARTKIAEFGRSINALNADEAGLENFIYVGPKDGITRPFCRKLVGKVLSKKQIIKLDNGQPSSGPPLTAGGGYNCRHSWAPVSKGFLKVNDLAVVSDSEIKDIMI